MRTEYGKQHLQPNCRGLLSHMAALIAALLLPNLTACRNDAPAPTTRPTAVQTRPHIALAATDFVSHPAVDPAEKHAGPARIITMAPNLTELVWALGLGSRQVGRTQFCNYPPQAASIDMVGAVLDPNLERIMTLQPDLVLVTPSPALREKLQTLNLPVHAMPDSRLEDILDSCREIGRLTQRPATAATLVRNLQTEIDNLRQAAATLAAGRQLRVLMVTGPLPDPPRAVWVAGPTGYLDTLLSMAGATNTVAGIANKPWLEITPEQVAWQKPDVIVEVREPREMALQTQAGAAWRDLPGLAHTRIVTLDEPAMLVPGPRVNIMLAKLVDGLYAN